MNELGTHYIQIDLGTIRTVTGVVTQGDAKVDAWVKTYKVMYASYQDYFTRVHDEQWDPKVFNSHI